MRFINTLALVIAALSITAECQYLSFGGCAQIPDINDFDIEKVSIDGFKYTIFQKFFFKLKFF